MTLFFATTATCCLIVIALFAAKTDADARQRIDAGLLTQARQVSVGVGANADGFTFGSATDGGPAAGLAAIGSSPTGFIDFRSIEYASPSDRALPSAAVINVLFAQATSSKHPAYVTAPDMAGLPRRWVARTVGDDHNAIVVVGTANTTRSTQAQIDLGLVLDVVVLASLSSFLGHLLSGRVMRPAVQEVEQHEQFLREAAHELRTPLTTLTLLIDAGLRTPGTEIDTLHELDRRLQKTTTLVGNLLLRARADLDPNTITMRPLRLDHLVDVTVSELPDTSRLNLQLTASTVTGNTDLIAQALRNLVENALRYAPDGLVVVAVTNNVLTVADAGPGFAATEDPDLPRTGTGTSTSTGTGLSIVDWIVQLHHATVTITSGPEIGTTAQITFPGTRSGRP